MTCSLISGRGSAAQVLAIHLGGSIELTYKSKYFLSGNRLNAMHPTQEKEGEQRYYV